MSPDNLFSAVAIFLVKNRSVSRRRAAKTASNRLSRNTHGVVHSTQNNS